MLCPKSGRQDHHVYSNDAGGVAPAAATSLQPRRGSALPDDVLFNHIKGFYAKWAPGSTKTDRQLMKFVRWVTDGTHDFNGALTRKYGESLDDFIAAAAPAPLSANPMAPVPVEAAMINAREGVEDGDHHIHSNDPGGVAPVQTKKTILGGGTRRGRDSLVYVTFWLCFSPHVGRFDQLAARLCAHV